MSSNKTFDDADLKARLAHCGMVCPITYTTRLILIKYLQKKNMSSNNTFNDADLRSKLSQYGIVTPITNTTRNVLIRKLQKLEKDSPNKQTNQSTEGSQDSGVELMDTTSNDQEMNEYEIRDGISKLGYAGPLTDSTRIVLSKKIRKNTKN